MSRFFKKGSDKSPEEQKIVDLLDPKTPGSRITVQGSGLCREELKKTISTRTKNNSLLGRLCFFNMVQLGCKI